jgi:putative inorganic carbon (hco3(-)) transporter
MRFDPQLEDYEPVTRPKGSGGEKREARDFDWLDEGKNGKPKPTLTAVEAKTEKSAPKEAKPKIKWERLKETWLIKRGHTISFIGLFLFTFLVYFRPYEWSPSLYFLSSGAYWIANFTLLVFIPTQLGLENTITTRPREVNLVLGLFLLSILSIPLATDPAIAWNGVTIYFKVVVMFIVMVNVVRTEARMKALFFMVLITACVLGASAINDYRTGNLLANGQRIAGVIGGMFDNPNDLALHLVTTIPIAISLLIITRMPHMKIFYAVCVVLAMGGIVSTFSRGGFLGMSCALGTLAWRLARRNKMLIPITLGFVVMVLVIFAPSGYGDRLRTTSDGSAMTRTDDLKKSILVAVRHPLLGVGMDNYYLYSNTEHASHNAYTQVASELGLTAAAFYILFLITPIRQLRRIAQEDSEKGTRTKFFYLAIGLEASLIGYMVSSFFASVAFVWYAYYLVAYAICLRRLHDTERPIAAQASPDTGMNRALILS